jgi:hypothetical protein
MRYNKEKINQIGQLLAEVVEEAIETEGQEAALIGEVVMREGLRLIRQRSLQGFLEAADGEAEAEKK